MSDGMIKEESGSGVFQEFNSNERFERVMLWAGVAILWAYLAYCATIYLELRDQILVGWGLLAVLSLAVHQNPRTAPARVFILLLGAFLSLRYWMFRTFETLSYTGPWDCVGMLLLYGAESYGITIHLLGLYVNIWPLERDGPPQLPEDTSSYPTVDILIPTYNEPEEIVRTTAVACTLLDYPREKFNVYILDDGGTLARRNNPDPNIARAAQDRHERLKKLAEEIGVHYMTREENVGAKAGNINTALQCLCSGSFQNKPADFTCLNAGIRETCSDLILILDCDHVPTRDFLRRTVPYFLQDDKVFLVQTPHFFINPSPVEKNLGVHRVFPAENEMFYRRVHLGLDFWNASFFCGSAALLRRSCLMEIGGIKGETITEDAETALELHKRGYRSVYVSRPMVCGLSPETFDDFILQRTRWAQGMIQILLLKNPLFAKGLSLSQKLCYLNSCLFWLFGLARIVFFLAPLAYLYFGLRVYNASVIQVLAYALPHLLGSTLVAHYLYGTVRHTLFSEFFETVQSLYLLPAIFSTLKNPRSPQFKVTPKGRSLSTDFLSPLAYPFFIMLVLVLLGIAAAAHRWTGYPMERDVIVICLFWNLYNLGIIFLCLGAVWEMHQWRRHHRVTIREPADGLLQDGRILPVQLRDLSLGGAGLWIAHEHVSWIHKGDRLILLAQDGTRRPYRLEVKVLRIGRVESEPTAGAHVGCEWVLDTPEKFAQVVGFIYGDSERWRRLWESRPQDYMALWRGYGFLLKTGVQKSFRSFSGLLGLLTGRIRRMAATLWMRRVKKHTEAL